MSTTTLRITGMTCNNCVRHVGEALRAVEGVAGVDVKLADGSASITHPQPIDPSTLIAAVESAGYEARVE